MSERDDMRAQIMSLVQENERLRRGLEQRELFLRLPLPAEVESALVSWCKSHGIPHTGSLSGRATIAARVLCISLSALIDASDAVASALRDVAGDAHDAYLSEYESAAARFRVLLGSQS